MVICTPKKSNIGLQDGVSISHANRSRSLKDMEGYGAMQYKACLDHKTSTAIMADFSDIRGQKRIPASLHIKVRQESMVSLNRNSSVKRKTTH